MTVERLLRSISMRELMEWRQFLQIERGGGKTQTAVDLDDQIRAAFAPLCFGRRK